MRICLILCWLFILTLPDIALAQSKIDVPVDTALEHLEIPKSFPKELVPQASFRIEIADQKAGGLHAIYANRASGDGIHIITEYGTDRSSSAARRASAKAYLNSTVQKYAAAGFKVVKMLPRNLKQQFDGLDFSKEQRFTLHFAGPETSTLFVRILVFFTDKGFCVTTASGDLERLDQLNKIADGLRPSDG